MICKMNLTDYQPKSKKDHFTWLALIMLSREWCEQSIQEVDIIVAMSSNALKTWYFEASTLFAILVF